MPLFAIVIFLSAFLLFQVQPMIAKVILPWFGSSAGVWTACLMFFQTALLLGYFYAHGIVRKLSWRGQTALHIVLLGVSLLALPIMPSEFWKPTTAGDPTWSIVLMLLACVGGPYLMLASTGPLLQRWFGRLHPGRSPYRLFALSNAGSLAGLLTYPFMFEPRMTLHAQTTFWSVAYGGFVLACGSVAFLLWRRSRLPEEAFKTTVAVAEQPALQEQSAPINARQIMTWLGLSACGSIMLLSTTNLMCQDIAAVPFLWVVPLAIYLLTFIVAFDSPRWYLRSVFLPAAICGAAVLLWVSIDPDGVAELLEGLVGRPVLALVLVFSAGLFAICMGCHGELARSKPHPSRLTLFYLCISAGGALGGLVVGIFAPLFFLGYWEFPIAIVLSLTLIGIAAASQPGETNGLLQFLRTFSQREKFKAFFSPSLRWEPFWLAGVVAVAGGAPFSDAVVRSYLLSSDRSNTLVEVRRNFFGVWRTTETYRHLPGLVQPVRKRSLVHGRIVHGYQFTGSLRRATTSYYSKSSGFGLAITLHPKRNSAAVENPSETQGNPIRFGMIGLGTGTAAAYAGEGDYLRFYEINPMMAETAETVFYYLSDARNDGADVEVILGDARLKLEQQAAAGDLQRFDVLAVDAFSGDAIPVHLLTKECYDIYWKHLESDGILAIHISNRYLELEHVIRGLAETDNRRAFRISDAPQKGDGIRFTSNEWMLVTRNQEFIDRLDLPDDPPPDQRLPTVLWTDDFSSLLSVLQDRTAGQSSSSGSEQDQPAPEEPSQED
ncbi:MAG: fused MFS/spermidine synthase [Pirellulales bacterium]|nr:fused MFS/spermidine synthase [Pirellulales bacterium]